MPHSIQLRKIIYGALLFGSSALTGDATLMAAAGGLGVNWVSEALASIWQERNSTRSLRNPITRATSRAIRRAVITLKETYRGQYGSKVDLKPFDLVRDCADSVTEATPSPDNALTSFSANRTLSNALDQLLMGHDEQAVVFLKRELMGAVARAFREQLDEDLEAWQAFHSWLIERIASQVGVLSGKLERFDEVSGLLTQHQKALEAHEAVAKRLEARILQLQEAQAAASAPEAITSFHNMNLEVGANLSQAAGNITQGRGFASVTSPDASSPVSFTNTNVKVQGSVNQAGGSIHTDTAPRSDGVSPDATSRD